MIHLNVKGNPQALKRHRTFRRGNFTGSYDPSKTAKQDFLAKVAEKAPETPIETPVTVEMEFYFARPKNHYRTGKYAGEKKPQAPDWHISRPDCDNLIKFVLDALNGVYWRDDSVVCKLKVVKKYADRMPQTIVNIYDC